MVKGYTSYFLFLLVFSVIIFNADSQEALDYTKLTRKDGLSSNTIYSVFQDEKGFIWVGTANGLDVYDGIRFHHFKGREDNPIPLTAVTQVMKDKRGNLWLVNNNKVGIFNTQFLTYTPATIQVPKSQAEVGAIDYELWTDSKSNLFLTIEKYGVLKYDERTNSFSANGIPFNIPPEWRLNAVVEESNTGNYWISSDYGIAVYNTRSKQLMSAENNPSGMALFNDKRLNQISKIFFESDTSCWIIQKDENKPSLYHYNFKSNQLCNANIEVSGIKNFFRLNSLFKEKDGKLWLYGYGALLGREKKDRHFSNTESSTNGYGINYTSINKIYEDRESNTWIATDAGMYVLHAHKKAAFTILPPHNKHLLIADIFNTSEKKLLVSTWGDGIRWLDSDFQWKDNQFFHRKKPTDSNYQFVMGLYQDKKSKDIWACCQNGRLIIFNEQRNIIKYLRPRIFKGIDFRYAREDKKGNLWFNTFDGNVVKWKRGNNVNEEDFEIIQKLDTKIWTEIMDRSGNLWLGTIRKGVYVIDPSTGKIIHHFEKSDVTGKSLFDNYVTSINQYNDSIFFVSTGSLNIININTGAINQVVMHNGLPFNKILVSEIDKNGFLWLTTADGMYKYNYTRNELTEYGEEDGFTQTNLLNESTRLLPDGTLLFGGTDNLLAFNPDKIKSTGVPPDVRVSLFQLFSTFLPVDSLLSLDQVKLNYTQNTFTIYFSSLSFSQRNNIAYYYMLKGIDHEWIKANSLAYCNYNSMPPGHYTLMLKAVNNEGVSSSNITTLAIYIKPPFWNTWWFSVLIGLLLAAIIYYIYRIRINRLLAIQAIRAKVARDLHDDVGSTLTTINILSEIAKTKTTGNGEETKVLIEKISDNSSRMMEAMGDIVWSINPANDSMKKIIARMREYAVTLLEAKNIEFSFSVDDTVEQLALNIEARLDFYLIFKETINNLVKYARSTEVSIAIIHEDKKLVMQVRDNGAGFDMDNYKKGNGLANMRKRAKNINAVIDIQSAPGKGTYVEVKMQVAK